MMGHFKIIQRAMPFYSISPKKPWVQVHLFRVLRLIAFIGAHGRHLHERQSLKEEGQDDWSQAASVVVIKESKID